MKKTIRYIVTAAMVFCLTQAAALAAAPVSVQLDGEAVTFTDAVPQIVSDRTFLPVRAVFEAMGAKVGYDGGVVTAVRDGKTVTMTIGSTEASVTEDGKTTPLTMDVAPFIDASVNRTYVPVRFAAQALGADVGWDAAARTVVIVDAEKLLDDVLEGKSFTYLEKLAAYSKKYNEGVWNSEVAMNGTVNVDLGAADPETPLKFSIPAAVTAKGVTADQTKLEITEKMTADLSSLKDLLAAATEKTDAAALDAMVKALAGDGVTYSIRGDLSAGKIYVNMDLSALGSAAGEIGLDQDAWYVMDVNAIYRQMGIDLNELLEQAKDVDYKELLKQLLAEADVNDAANGYKELSETLRTLVDALSDNGFVKNGNNYTTAYRKDIDGMTIQLALSLVMPGDAVTSYGVSLTLGGSVEGAGKVDMAVEMIVNENDKLSGSLTMNVADLVKADFDITGGYTRGSAAPTAEPPAGARVIDLMELAGTLPRPSGF